MDTVDEVLAHYGVPGMKWGKRKSPSGGSGSSAGGAFPKAGAKSQPPVVTRSFGRKVKPTLPKEESNDAVVFKAIKAKAKNKGIDSLSNDEMRRVTDRFNLERNYGRAFPKKKNPVVKFLVNEVLVKEGKRQLSDYIMGDASKKSNTLIGKALAAGTAKVKK